MAQANALRGEVNLDADHILRFGTNELVKLGRMLQGTAPDAKPLGPRDLGERLKVLSLDELRDVVRIGLERHHKGLDLDQVGDIIDAGGGLVSVMTKVAEAFMAAFGAPKAASPNAQSAAAPSPSGTGSDTSVTH